MRTLCRRCWSVQAAWDRRVDDTMAKYVGRELLEETPAGELRRLCRLDVYHLLTEVRDLVA